MDKCLKSDFTFQMASSFPSTTLRKKHGAQRSELRRTASPDDNRCRDRQMLS